MSTLYYWIFKYDCIHTICITDNEPLFLTGCWWHANYENIKARTIKFCYVGTVGISEYNALHDRVGWLARNRTIISIGCGNLTVVYTIFFIKSLFIQEIKLNIMSFVF